MTKRDEKRFKSYLVLAKTGTDVWVTSSVAPEL